MQFCLCCVAAVGAFWVHHREKMESRFWENPQGVGRYAWILLTFALVTMGLLIFSDQFWAFWRPLSADVRIIAVTWSTALLWVFVSDIVCSAVLVYLTGGSYGSPFTPVYFILPAMAFFLRESPRRIVFYVFGIAIVFSLGLNYKEGGRNRNSPPEGAYWFVSVSCLFLSALIGYLTRPH